MWEICVKYVPMLGLAILLNTLIGLFNNIAIRRFQFRWSILLTGLGRAALFVVCIFGLAFIMDHVDVIADEISPEILLQTGTLYYAGKVFIALKDMILPNTSLKQIPQAEPKPKSPRVAKTASVTPVDEAEE